MNEHESGDLGEHIRAEIERGLRRGLRHEERHERHERRGWTFGFGPEGDAPSADASDVEERRFIVTGVPRVRIGNVSGRTEVHVGQDGEVAVTARKRVHGWSEERAKRLLENVEVRMEQRGDEITVELRLFQQERGWLDLLRGGRVAVDLDVLVPRETHLLARTVSGDVSVSGLRGTVELQSVSGEIETRDVRGPLRLRTVSGDAEVTEYAGRLEVNSTSGDIDVTRSRVRAPEIVTVSGDVNVDAVFAGGATGEARFKSVSGDIEIGLADADAEVDFRTVSGDAEAELAARTERVGRRDRRIVVGAGGPQIRVKTVSGDLTIRAAGEMPAGGDEAAPDEPVEMATPVAEAVPAAPAAREILERLARGEIGVDEAAAALDAKNGT